MIAVILAWLAIGTFKDMKLNQAPPMEALAEDEPSIGNLIAPMVEQADTFSLIFEDELPNPIASSGNVSKASHQDRHQIAL
ncbi:MAG: hypothetical protein Q9M44_01775, partial [Ghiorsea sp.]|nr:hypothetical protein [Ghiorsea sp.]